MNIKYPESVFSLYDIYELKSRIITVRIIYQRLFADDWKFGKNNNSEMMVMIKIVSYSIGIKIIAKF